MAAPTWRSCRSGIRHAGAARDLVDVITVLRAGCRDSAKNSSHFSLAQPGLPGRRKAATKLAAFRRRVDCRRRSLRGPEAFVVDKRRRAGKGSFDGKDLSPGSNPSSHNRLHPPARGRVEGEVRAFGKGRWQRRRPSAESTAANSLALTSDGSAIKPSGQC